jgi:hypothetical protein
MASYNSPNESLVATARHAVSRTSWQYSDNERQCRELIISVLENLYAVEKLMEIATQEVETSNIVFSTRRHKP